MHLHVFVWKNLDCDSQARLAQCYGHILCALSQIDAHLYMRSDISKKQLKLMFV